jgi:acyl carrier protein
MNPIEELKQIIAVVMELDPGQPIEDDADLINDLGMASIDFVELTVAIEKKFGVPVPIEVLSDTSTVYALSTWIAQHTAQVERVAAS